MKKEIDLLQFLSTATPEDVDEFVANFCGGSRNQLYQIKGGHRRLGPQKARDAATWLAEKGYNVPLHRIRPDIWAAT